MGATPSHLQDAMTVWLVEDDDEFGATLRARLNESDDLLCSEVFPSGEALLSHLNSHFAPDVVLMDIGLPGLTGIETVAPMRRRHPGSRVVMLTVHEDNDRIFDALCAGACGYLSKGTSPDGIAQAIRDVMAGGSAMTPQIARRVIDMFAQLRAPQFDYGLTDRELDVLRELARGKSKKRIAADLHLSVHTVDTHLRSVYQKMHVSTATQAVGKAVGERLV